MSSTPDEEFEAAHRQALDALAGRDLLTTELEARLARADRSDEVAARVLDALREQGLLDDHRVAIERVRRWRREGRSTANLHARLAAAGLDDSTIGSILAAASASTDDPEPAVAPEIDAAVAAIRRRGRGLELSDPSAIRTLVARLARAGFDADTIRAALRHCDLDDAVLDEGVD
jgi:SOS response regulatory protein OraA/RecX